MPFLIHFQGRDGTVVKVYGPPLHHYIGPNGPEFPLFSQEDPRAKVPQLPYECGNTQKNWVAKPPIHFFTQDCLGVRLLNARDGVLEGVNDRDKPPFDIVCRGITIRIHVGPMAIGSLQIAHVASSFRGTLPAPRLRRD